MYIIINKTRQTCTRRTGNFPALEQWLDKGDKIIIISLYSNTIKVPYFIDYNGINQWEWEKSMGSIKSRILTTQI